MKSWRALIGRPVDNVCDALLCLGHIIEQLFYCFNHYALIINSINNSEIKLIKNSSFSEHFADGREPVDLIPQPSTPFIVLLSILTSSSSRSLRLHKLIASIPNTCRHSRIVSESIPCFQLDVLMGAIHRWHSDHSEHLQKNFVIYLTFLPEDVTANTNHENSSDNRYVSEYLCN